jgi:hypothetical protein
VRADWPPSFSQYRPPKKRSRNKPEGDDKQKGEQKKAMVVSPISNLNSVSEAQGVPAQSPITKNAAAPEQPADKVQLSPAAMAHLNGGDADHDGDRR